MNLQLVAQETLKILDEGKYTLPSGKVIDISEDLKAAAKGTGLITPKEGRAMVNKKVPVKEHGTFITSVTKEPVETAAARLVKEGADDLVVLNFASATRLAGGFLDGAQAQEECIARCSGLFLCLLEVPEYYEQNRQHSGGLYTDHTVFSPGVPWFRKADHTLLNKPFKASIITSPAPNVLACQGDNYETNYKIEKTLRHRADIILATARAAGSKNLLLGAWGCGVFGNKPEVVAEIFDTLLNDDRYYGYFDHITFAVCDGQPGQPVLEAFTNQFT